MSTENPSELDMTLRQTGEALEETRDISLVKGVEQDVKAPKIPGYVLTAPVGQGAYAQVWKAWQVRTGKMVAVKVFTQSGGANWLFLQREVERMVRLDKHPNVVSLLNADLGGAVPYYVMELMEAGSLDRYVNTEKPVPVGKAVMWMEEIASALAYVHAKGVIHCDLKPANVMEDENGHARVVDFGQARAMTDSHGALGTLFYMAPEQAVTTKEGEVVQPDVRWDVYALGATVYAMLTGKAPHGETMRTRLETSPALEDRLRIYRDLAGREAAPSLITAAKGRVDEDLAAIVGKCLEAVADRRYGSAGAVLQDLTARKERRPVGPLAHRRGYRARRYVQRNLAAVVIGGLALAGLLVSGGRIVVQRAQLKEQVEAGLLIRAQQCAERQDHAAAAAVYAELNRIAPSDFARASALAHLDRLAIPELELECPGLAVYAAFSPDGKRLLTGQRDNSAIIWDVATGKQAGGILRHKNMVATDVAGAFSPDGKVVATVSPYDGEVRMWTTETGQPVCPPADIGMSAGRVYFTPDGTRLVVCQGGLTLDGVLVLDAKTLKPLGSRIPGGLAMIPKDGRFLLTASGAKFQVWDWDAVSMKPRGPEIAIKPAATGLALSPDGTRIAYAGINNTIQILDLATRKTIGRTLFTQDATYSLDFSPDGTKLVSASNDGNARIWNVQTWEPVGGAMRHEDAVMQALFTPDGRFVVTRSLDRTVRVWDAGTGKPLDRACSHLVYPNNMVISPDGSRLAVVTVEKTMKIWKIDPQDSIKATIDAPQWADSVAVTPDGGRIIRSYYNLVVKFWSVTTGQPESGDIPLQGYPYCLAFLPSGDRAAVGCLDGTIALVDLKTSSVSGSMFAGEPVYCLDVSADGSKLVTGGAKGARLFSLSEPGQPGKLLEHQAVIRCAFSPDGTRILTVGNNKCCLWDADQGKMIALLHAGGAFIAAISPDGKWLATGGNDGTARFYATADGKPAGARMAHGDTVLSLAFSPDGRRLLTGSFDGAARVWKVPSGEPASKPFQHIWGVSVVAFSPDGRTAITSAYLGGVHLWDLSNGEQIGPTMDTGGPAMLLKMLPGEDRLLTVVSALPQVIIWPIKWLNQRISPPDLVRRVAYVAQQRVGPTGRLEPVPYAEKVRMRADTAVAKTP